ncbi:hypothetical protein BDZ97DRAFT_1810414 [Flammula alnicola]|nr:hypothetical protein BDZ97DRAFT_1810414 [Flammula alnicola]
MYTAHEVHARDVHSLALCVMDFVAEYDERNSLIVQIFNTTKQIHTAVAPLVIHESTTMTLQHSLSSLKTILASTLSHLEMWSHRRSHRLLSLYNPWLLVHRLKVDRKHLMEQYVRLMVALQGVDEVQGYNFISPALSLTSLGVTEAFKKHVESVAPPPNPEAKEFWQKYFEGEPESVDIRLFREALSKWSGEKLGETAYKRLLLRLDPDHTGNIQFSSFLEFVRNGKMENIIRSYSADPPLPLLIWIDEAVHANSHKVFEATTYGITVVQLASISSAKAWIAANYDFLKQNDDPAKIRFICQQVCYEKDEDGISYLRDQGFKAPVLISTSRTNMEWTKYVEKDAMAGSVASGHSESVYQAYVSAMGEGKVDDGRWRKYDA